MNSFKRFKYAVKHKQPDVVPVAPYMGNYGARLAGIPIDRYCQSGRLMAEAQYRAWEILGQDAVVPQSDNYYIAEGFGTTVEHHYDGTPTFKDPAIVELEQIGDLRIPDPRKDGRMPVYLEAVERLAAKLKGEVNIRGTGTGPFSLASHLMGTERFIMRLALLNVEPDKEVRKWLHRLMELTTAALTAFAMALIDAGADTVQAGDSLASLDIISPQIYEEWAFPYEKKFFTEINAYKPDKLCASLLHICGDTTKILDLMCETEAQILEIDSKVNMAQAARVVNGRSCLMVQAF